MSDLISRVAMRHLAAQDDFKVGDEVRFGKYKNRRGRIVRLFKDERGIPSVEIEPIPKGRKKNRIVGLYKIWKAPEGGKRAMEHHDDLYISTGGPNLLPVEVVRHREDGSVVVRDVSLAARHGQRPPFHVVRPEDLCTASLRTASFRKESCIIAGRRFGESLCLLKNRDRAYDAELEIVHLEKDGTEMAVVLDTVTGYIEGVNEYGVAAVNTTLMVVRDEAEGKKKAPSGKGKKSKKPLTSKDGPKIFRALAHDNIDDALESLRTDDDGIRGHTFVADGNRLYSIECSRNHPARVTELDPDRVNTRTNHGVSYPDAGYTHGDDYVSSVIRRWEAQKRLQDIKRPEAAAVSLVEAIHDPDSQFNPVRVTDHMRTTSQLTIDTTNPRLLLYLIPGHGEVVRTRNLLPEGREPKIPVRVFRYKEKMEDRAGDLGKKARDGRYKSKKKIKTKDGDEMTVYEYSDRQVTDRNRNKAERVEKLRRQMKKLQTKVRKDVGSDDEKTRDLALAVGLLDETFERVGNDESARDGHFGVTTWRVKHITFGNGFATISYVGKSGVDQKKKITNARTVSALKEACEDKKPDGRVLSVTAAEVNEYLKPFDITAKDIRGFHANREMKEQLRKVRKGNLPDDPKERKDRLEDEFKRALKATAEEVGHEPSTLRSQYLVPGLEDDYMKDGTVNESHAKKSAEVVTDTSAFYVIAPEALKGMLDDTPWYELSHELWPGDVEETAADGPAVWDEMERQVRESGGAVIGTGTDGGFDVGVKGVYDDRGNLETPGALKVVEKGALPPYGLRTAALHGTETERHILGHAVLAPVLVGRSRRWWLKNAPNIYRVAREHEKPRPWVDGLRFNPDFFTILWYEDADGNRLPDPDDGEGAPEGAEYQHSQFPHVLQHNVLRLDEDGMSTDIGAGSSSYPEDLVNAMVRSGQWDAGDAIMVAAKSCERCLNVLLDHYGLDGYPFGSEEYWRSGTRCDLCEHVDNSPEEEYRPRLNPRNATKSDAELEDEAVQKMLRKEPKKKPPRYDLRDNRTLDEEDDEEELGGGDDGDRDLSMKWNKVASRVAFRWTVLSPHPERVATLHVADAPAQAKSGPAFEEWAEKQKFTHPETRKEVKFVSLPPDEQTRIREKWKGQRKPEDDPKEKEKGKDEEEKKERTKDDVQVDLGNARDEMRDAEAQMEDLTEEIKSLQGKLKQQKQYLEHVHGEAKEKMESSVRDIRREIGRKKDELDDKKEEHAEVKERVDELKRERKDPGFAQAKREEKLRKQRAQRVERAVSKAQANVRDLLGKESQIPRELATQIADSLNDLDGAQVESFSIDFQDQLQRLKELDPSSDEAISVATRAAKFGDLHGLEDPSDLAERLAHLSYAQNVVANPMKIKGVPVGVTAMDGEKYSERARAAFDQFQHLPSPLRRGAAEEVREALEGLDPETHRAQELNAILTGMDLAQIASTGDSLPGRPQPSKGVAALIRQMVQDGNIDPLFKTSEDFFAEQARARMEKGLESMSPEEVGEVVTGGDPEHGYADMVEMLKNPDTPDAMRELMTDFLIQDVLNDQWGDRAVRDTMQAAGIEDADDPETRAEIISESKRRGKPRMEEVLGARERVERAQQAGQEPDPDDVETVQGYFDVEKGTGLREQAKALLDTIKDKFDKLVISPASAVLNHFVQTGERDVLHTETVPHPDDKAKEPRPREERERDRDSNRETPGDNKGTEEDEDHGPGDVWETEKGNWRAKNEDGAPKSFKTREEAERYAGKGPEENEEGVSGEFDAPVEERGPTRFAAERVAQQWLTSARSARVANGWMAHVRSFHPDDPHRPLFVLDAT